MRTYNARKIPRPSRRNGKKPLSVYSNDFTRIDLSAFGMAPNSTINPCKDFEGKKARIQYAEAADNSVDGQVIAIELRR